MLEVFAAVADESLSGEFKPLIDLPHCLMLGVGAAFEKALGDPTLVKEEVKRVQEALDYLVPRVAAVTDRTADRLAGRTATMPHRSLRRAY